MATGASPPGGAVRLTPSGSRTAALAVLAVVGGRIGGLPELSYLGLGTAALVLLSWVRLRARRPHLRVVRSLRPRRVPHGEACQVELEVANPRRRAAPVTVLTDHLDGAALAPLSLAPLAGRSSRVVRYRFTARRRGVARLGPLGTTAVDPFGLVRVEQWHAATTEAIVLPRLHPLDPVPPAPGEEPERQAARHRPLASAHDEAATLREYVPGDDVRHVHWPATARVGRPVVRQVEEPWQRRTVVLLDDRRGAHSDESFERAVSAAASVAVAAHRRGESVRLVRTDGADSGLVDATRRLEVLLDELAALQPRSRGSLGGALRLLAGDGGALVACLGERAEERAELAGAGRRHGRLVVVSCGAEGLPVAGATEVRFAHDDALTTAWQAAMATIVGPRPATGDRARDTDRIRA